MFVFETAMNQMNSKRTKNRTQINEVMKNEGRLFFLSFIIPFYAIFPLSERMLNVD